MRILQVIGSMNRGGAETFLMNVFRNIDRKKFKFYFLCYENEKFDYEDEIQKLGGEIIRITNNFSIYKNVKQICNIIKKYNINMVHSHTYYNSVFSVIASRLCNIKVIIHSHNTKSINSPNILQKLYYTVSKIIINKMSDEYFACSKEAADAMFYSSTNYDIIRNGIEVKKFIFDERKRKEIRNQLKIKDSTKVLCTIARFEEQKNHKFLIEVFKEYNKINNDSMLILVGRGNLKNKIEELVKKYNIENKVLFLGVRNDVEKIYSASDIFILPSLSEGLGIVFIEAQANGLKCIASKNVPEEANITGEIMYLDLNDGIYKWAEKIEKLDISRYNKHKAIVERGYDIKNTVEILEKKYSDLEK